MGIDGLIILDQTGRSVVQSGFRASPPAYPILHIDAVNNALEKAKRPEDVDPVLSVSHLNDPGCACCHVKVGELRFLCPISGNLDPVYAFSFLRTFIDILRQYFGTISADSLKENLDVVYQLLEETLDAGGHPLTTYPNTLRDIVIPPSLLQKVLSVAGVAGLASAGPSSHPFASPIPWRKVGVRYNNNEVYFDVVETLEAIVNKNGTPATSTVWGKIECNCRLSGTPDLLLSLSNAKQLSDCSFHACVRLRRWTQDKTLSFVPPDGRFKLVEYRYVPASTTAQYQVTIPFVLRTSVNIEEGGGSFDLTFTSRLTTRAMENVAIELYLGEAASGASCMASHNASWSFDPKTLRLRWELKSVPSSMSCTLRGTFTTTSKFPRPSRAFRVSFEIPQHSFSALKIDQLKLTGEVYKPYKGMRARSVGDVEWRW